MPEERTIRRLLKVNFDSKETVQLGGQMANAFRNLNRTRDELASVSAQYKSKIKEYEAEIATIAEKLNTGWEMRSVECVERWDYMTGNIEIFRNDTGEKIDERPMTGEERQQNLFDRKEAEAPAGKGEGEYSEGEVKDRPEAEPGVEGAEATPGSPPDEDLPEDTNPFYTGQGEERT